MSIKDDPSRPAWWSNDKWSTPLAFVQQVEAYISSNPFDIEKFEIDVCASRRTRKAPIFYSHKDDGLYQSWAGRVWCNPPYSNPAPWARRAAKLTYNKKCPLAVLLLPDSCLNTSWFHDWVLPYAELHFVRGRIAFERWDGQPVKGARQSNIVAIYRAGTADVQKPIVYHSHTFLADPTRSA